jgi:hypothetical protein
VYEDDERLLAELGQAVRDAESVPPRLVELGMDLFAFHDMDAELAALSFDSADLPGGVLAGTRASVDGPRALTFAVADVIIDVELSARALHGQVVPPLPGEIELRLRDGHTRATSVDEVGWFSFEEPPGEPFQLRLQTTAGRVVTTSWTRP